MSRDCTNWLDEAQLSALLARAGAGRDGREIPHTVIGGQRRWNFWTVQEWLDENVRRRYRN